MDRVSKRVRSRIMSKIRSKNTLPERIFWELTRELKTPPKRWASMPGKPDFVFEDAAIVVFVDGCFWHRCPRHTSSPKTNKRFWQDKFKSNVDRDRRITRELENSGWSVVRFWECVVKQDPDHVLCIIQTQLEDRLDERNDPRRQDSF